MRTRPIILLVSMALAGGACLSLAAGGAAQAPGATQPAMFVARDADTTIYLLGTVHAVPCVQPSDPASCASVISNGIETAIRESDEVWLEVPGVTGPIDEALYDSLMAELGFYREGTLADFIPEDEIGLIAEMLAPALGVPPDVAATAIAAMKPWFVNSLLAALMLEGAGTSWDGVDVQVEQVALELGIPIFGFETDEEQVRLLASAPDELQIAELRSVAVLLRHGVDLGAYARWAYLKMWDLWSAGDLEELNLFIYGDDEVLAAAYEEELVALLGLSQKEFDLLEAEVEALYSLTADQRMAWVYDLDARRNLNWMTSIGDMLARSGTFFIAVGAAHLLGERGLPALLEDHGAAVARLQ